MNHAAKLPISVNLSYLKEEFLAPHHSSYKAQKYGRGLQGTAVPYLETVRVLNDAEFISQLPEALCAIERPSVFLIKIPAFDADLPVLPAHVDINRTCGINVYLEAHEEVTKFYRWDREIRQSQYVEEFCAKAGDAWLMDTSVPHSVDLKPNVARCILTFSFCKKKYHEVLACF